MKLRVAIIGAGLSGLTLAHRLSDQTHVKVFEKARGVGGRMSTRYAEPYYFDHGTQFFTARGPHFKDFLVPHITSGLIQEWKGKVITLERGQKTTDRLWFEPHYVATPGMNSLCKKLAENIAIHLNCEIAPLGDKKAEGWELCDKTGQSMGFYDLVISTAPPIQTCRLLGNHLPPHSFLHKSKLLACYTLMYGFPKKWDQSWIGAKIHRSPLEWIAVNSTKPDRNNQLTSLVIHSSNSWAEEHCDADLKEMENFLRKQLQELVTIDLANPDYISLHRWRYALLDKAHDNDTRYEPYFDQSRQLAAVGDWCHRSRIEDTWLSANYLADRIIEPTTTDPL